MVCGGGGGVVGMCLWSCVWRLSLCDKDGSSHISVAAQIYSLYLELQLPRYKYVVQVVIGEQKGEGVK